MPTHKRIDGDYTITTVNSADTVTVDTHTMEVLGNLIVRGNVTYIEVTELTVDDPFVTVAANNSGTGNTAVFPNQGLVAQTGSNTFAGLRFHNDTQTWQVSDNVDANGDPITAYSNIGVGNSLPGGPANSVQYNSGASTFGGDAALLFDSGQAQLALSGHLALGNIGSAPAAVANSTVIYHNEIGAGDTGVYVRSAVVQDELVSRRRAVVFGLIF